MSSGIRPMAFTKNPDGSTKEIIVQLSDFHGFAVVDFAARKEVNRVTLPDPPGQRERDPGHSRRTRAWAGDQRGRQSPVGHQQVLRLPGGVLAAGFETAESHPGGKPSRMAYHPAGWQEYLRGGRG